MGYSVQIIGKAVPYTPTFGGFSVDPTILICEYTILGDFVLVHWRFANGTSNATTFTCTVPFAADDTNSAIQIFGGAVVTDNGGVQATPGSVYTVPGSTTCNIYKTCQLSSTWTNSGGKSVNITFIYKRKIT